jgi:O-antigen/teichoic acid export membrane protein
VSFPSLKRFELNRFNSLQLYQFLRTGSFFLISILLAKITYHQYGSGGYGTLIISRYELLLLVSGSLTFFWVSGICNTLIPYYNASDEARQKRILFNAFVLLTAFSFLASIATLVIGYFVNKGQKLFEIQSLFQMFAIVVFLNTPTYLTDYIFYLKGKYRSLIFWGIITFSSQILLLCLPIYMGQTLNLAINLWLILSLLKFNYTIILLMKYSTISVHTRLIQQFMKKVMPFMFSILLAGSMDFINSYIIQIKFSDVEFAIFRYGAKELPIFLIFANSLSNIYSGEIANMNREGQLGLGLSKLRDSSRKLMYWLFPGAIVLMFCSRYLFELAYNKDLVEGYKIFNIYLLLIISRMIFPQTVIMGLMKNRIFYLVSINYIIINIMLAYWFVGLFGIAGIAYAIAISNMVEKVMLVIYCKIEGIRFQQYTAIPEYVLFSLLCVSAYFVTLYLDGPPF